MGTAFIGRDREQAELLAGLQDALRGRGGVFLIAGEPGIGKTALAENLAGVAAEHGAGVAWSRAWSGDEATPYWAWAQIIRSLTASLTPEIRRSLLGRDVAHLSRLVPELADQFGDGVKPVLELDSEAEQFYLFEAVARFLKRASSVQPLMLILDDLLAGDRSSLLLLRFLAREVPTAHLLLIATYRDSEATRSQEVIEVLADLLREGFLLSLGKLDQAEAGRLIAEITGVTPWMGKVAAIHEATGGNPLFVREVARLLASHESLDRPGKLSIPVPESVRAVIRRRIAPLSAEAVQVLSAAAVVGRDFDITLVRAASSLPVEKVLVAIAEAVALGIVAEAADTAGVYRFSHPLMREGIYEGLPLPARTQMHQRVGAAIELLHGTDSPSHLAELAHHYSRAAGLGEGVRAGEYAQRAGDRALASFAYEEAVVQYRRALDSLSMSGSIEPSRRCELLLRLGWAQTRAGEYHQAKPTLLLAVEIARELGDAAQLARAALGIGEQLIEGGVVDRQLVTLLEEAIDRLGREDSILRVRLLARLSLELTFADEARRVSYSLEAIQIARRLGDPRALSDALRARWMARWGPDGVEERFALAEELLAIAHESGDREKELIGLAQRATCLLQSGDGAAADMDISAHGRLAAELRMPYHQWAAATMRAGQSFVTGSLDQVEALAHGALERLPSRPNARLAYLNQLSALRWEQGRLGELQGEWEELASRLPQLGFARAWLCLAAHQLGHDLTARRHLQDLMSSAPDWPRDGLWPLGIGLSALAAATLEDADAATILYPLLLPYAHTSIVLPMLHPALCLGSTSLYLGLLTTEIAAWDEAEDHFEAAIVANQRLNARPLLARTHYEYARMLLRRQGAEDRARAVGQLNRAAAFAGEVRLPQLTVRIEELRERTSNGPGVSAVNASAKQLQRRDEPAGVDTRDHGPYLFRREGDYWTIEYDDAVVRLPDSKGLRCLARLLAHPGHQMLALDLESTDARSTPIPGPTLQHASAEGDLVLRMDSGDAGELLDAQAKAAYRARLDELQEELDEAERFNDPARAARAREEKDFLVRELARAVGLGGRDRKAASQAERARLNVTRAIRAAMKNLDRVHPALAHHLTLTIRTGRYCSYAPDPRVPIRWEM